eukprot:8283347-Lingulodinium_polyedra.AAC.1
MFRPRELKVIGATRPRNGERKRARKTKTMQDRWARNPHSEHECHVASPTKSRCPGARTKP